MWEPNQDAWELWLEIETQWRTSFAGKIGLDYTVLYAEAERMDIDLIGSTKRKIQHLERLELGRQNQKEDGK